MNMKIDKQKKKQPKYKFAISKTKSFIAIFATLLWSNQLNIFENDIFPFGCRLNFQRDGTLQPNGEHFFREANQETHFLRREYSPRQNYGNSNMIELSFDYNLAADDAMKRSSDEFPNEHIFDGRLRRSQTVR